MSDRHYDYIIAGAGLSGLSLAWNLVHSPLANKRLLIVDKNLTPTNEKTWSFWHRGQPPFKQFVHKSWNDAEVIFNGSSIKETLKNYTYHSIRSGVFLSEVLKTLRDQPCVDLLEAPIESIFFNGRATLQTPDHSYTADYIFQSCFPPGKVQDDHPKYPLIQHFIGWEIQTGRSVFNSAVITLMDFDTSFTEGVAFIYILPWSPKKALIEYTIFSDSVKKTAFYKEKLAIYLYNKFNLRSLDFKVERTESGQIPMQDRRYRSTYAKNIVNLGTVGGQTKPSTGYTFSRIQQHVDFILSQLIENKDPGRSFRSPFRYRAYDLWLLHIIYNQPKEALKIFQQLFRSNSVDEVFRFLSEENSLMQDLKMMSKVSYPPFFKAMWKTKKRLLQL